ncbi:chlorohydrolase family protein [Bacillus coreaensis]
MKTKVKSHYVIGYDGKKHQLLENAEVVFEKDTILYVGPFYNEEVDQTLDMGEAIVCPGFIDLNALGDIDHDSIHLEQRKDRAANMLWSKKYFDRGPKEFLSKEEEAFKSLYAYTQLILNGITTAMPITSVLYKRWAETYEELVAAADHAKSLGLRVYLGPSYQAGMRVVHETGDISVIYDEDAGLAGLERAVKFVQTFDGAADGLIRGMLAPERIETQTQEVLRQTKAFSRELGCPVRLHAAQGKFEYNYITTQMGKTPIRYLYELGFLDKNTAIPHGIFTSEFTGDVNVYGSDLALLQETKTTIIHCPLIMGRHGGALDSFASYKERGIPLAIGTDTFPPDMFINIRTASMVSRLRYGEVYHSKFSDIFHAATIGSAEFLGRSDLGRLAPGAKADLIAVDLSGFHFGPIDDPFITMCMSATGRDIVLSIINGQIVMKNRLLPGIDLDELKIKGQSYFNKLKTSYVERDYEELGADQLFTKGL